MQNFKSQLFEMDKVLVAVIFWCRSQYPKFRKLQFVTSYSTGWKFNASTLNTPKISQCSWWYIDNVLYELGSSLLQSIQRDQPGAGDIYETVRSEVRRAISEIQIDLESVSFMRSWLSSCQLEVNELYLDW